MRLYCINLKRSEGRRRKMQAQFDKLALPIEFIEAVDGRGLTESEVASVYDKWRTRFGHGRGLSRGEIGCALSHVEFYRRVVAADAPGFVFEDDVELNPEVLDALKQTEMFLAKKMEPCLVQLPGLERDLPRSRGESETFVKVSAAMGAYAYGVNPAGARLLLKAFSPIKFPIDYYGHLVKYYGLSLYVYGQKPLSVDMVGDSTIGEGRFMGKGLLCVDRGVGWLLFKLWRLVGKTIDGAMRIMERRKR